MYPSRDRNMPQIRLFLARRKIISAPSPFSGTNSTASDYVKTLKIEKETTSKGTTLDTHTNHIYASLDYDIFGSYIMKMAVHLQGSIVKITVPRGIIYIIHGNIPSKY